MLLKTRIALLVAVATLALWTVSGVMLVQRDADLTQQLHTALLQTQQIAWKLQQEEANGQIEETITELLQSPLWRAAWRSQNMAEINEQLRQKLTGRAGWRADVYDAQQRLRLSTMAQLQLEPLMEGRWISQFLQARGQGVTSGLSQISSERYYWVGARALEAPVPEKNGGVGVLAIGMELPLLLPALARSLGGEVFLLNVRGREIAGTEPGLLARQGWSVPTRLGRVSDLESASASQGASANTATTAQSSRHSLAVVLPLAGPDGRKVGALLLVRDITRQRTAERQMTAFMLVLGVLFSAALGAGLFVYLRRAFNPLERSVQVLNALSRGELNASLDEGDEALQDEAGQIARGVASLRLELLSLQMLRDERLRIRRQQERLIRTQLKLLADSLDDVSRLEILQALQTDGTQVVKPVDGPDNTLADLAKILGRMSGLVTTQQGRLVALLKELRAAMEQQALLVSLQQELEIARSMQLSILPRQAPSTEVVEVDALMVPAKEVGGDFYDYFLVGDQHLALVVADVSGKGIPAAFFMAISRTLLKNNATLLAEPAHIMARLNDQLCSENEQMMFVTVFFGLLELATGKLDYVNAGHNPPVLRRADGTVSLLPSGQNTALAVIDGLDYVPGQLTLANGDLLLLYTDGVTEAANAQDQLFGETRMLDIVQAHQPGQPSQTSLTQAVLQQIRVFEAGAAQADDITCVSVLYKGQA